MRRQRFRGLGASSGLLVATVVACVSGAPLQKLCDPGTFVFCRCPDGEEGSRQCDASGQSFTICQLQTGGDCPNGTTTSGTGGAQASTTIATTDTSTSTAATTASTTTGAVTSTSTSASTSTGTTSTSASTGTGAAPGTLFFSEYVEGSSFNKALEIVNRGQTPTSLQGCAIVFYFNGSTTASAPLALNSVMLAGGQTYVVCHTSFSQPALCTQLDAKVLQTGNDVVELQCNGMPVDIIGRIGENAVWGTPPTSTQGATLRRKCTVLAGDTNGNDPFDPATEWNGFPIDTFSDLGNYTCP